MLTKTITIPEIIVMVTFLLFIFSIPIGLFSIAKSERERKRKGREEWLKFQRKKREIKRKLDQADDPEEVREILGLEDSEDNE